MLNYNGNSILDVDILSHAGRMDCFYTISKISHISIPLNPEFTVIITIKHLPYHPVHTLICPGWVE